MLLKTRISQQQVDELALEVGETLKPVTIERGFNYYIKGRVNKPVIDKDRVKAMVHGTHWYQVNIDLAYFHLSQCSCPVQVECKHIAAVFFYLYAIYYVPETIYFELLARPKGGGKGTKTEAMGNHGYSWGREPAKKPGVQAVGPSENGTVEEWDEFFVREFKGLEYTKYDSYNLSAYEKFVDSLARQSGAWSDSLKDLFALQGYLYVMEQMEKRIKREKEAYYVTNYFRHISGQFIPEILGTGVRLNDPEARKSYAPHYKAAIGKLGKLLLGEDFFFDWLNIYRQLWSYAFRDLAWVKEEGRSLDLFLEQHQDEASLVRHRGAAARAFLAFMVGDDETAWQRMEEAGAKVKDVTLYLHFFQHHGKWERLCQWLRWLSPRVNRVSYSEVDAVSMYWMLVAEHEPVEEEAMEIMKSWLPQSRRYYAQNLVATERYRTWVEFHVFDQTPHEVVNRGEIKRIEAVDPSLLLPLYHHWAARLIEEKKRPSYKEAVMILKKLRDCYRKLKRAEDWDQFIGVLMDNHSRLRAFQEEMRKGNLLT
ncbi:MAG: SWIM zinc finger family protein [Thermincolia bacterium]